MTRVSDSFDVQRLSVIIPVLNEGEFLPVLLNALQSLREAGHEVIVVDGGSEDATAGIARAGADAVLHSSPGRALQMNLGARQAGGKVMWFLHADALPTEGVLRSLRDALRNDHECWGRFDVHLSGADFLLPLVAWAMNLRSRMTGICTGDQGLFMTREAFDAVGGFPDIALMEDIAMSRALKRLGPPLCLREKLTVSGRRWDKRGTLRTIVLMWWLRLAFALGVAPSRLAKWYCG